MAFAGISHLAVLVAAVAGFAFGALWYSALGKHWMAALGIIEQPKPNPALFIMTFLCQLFMAWMLAGMIGHLGEVTILRSLLTAAFVWAGFVLTTMLVNHRFQSQRWSLTLIDGAHWLGVLLVMGLVVGLFGV